MLAKGRKMSKAGGRRLRKVNRRKVYKKKLSARTDYAKCVATRDLDYDSNGIIYKFSEFSLPGWSRAINVAQSYQFYRIVNIEMKFIPTADTYISGSPGSVPSLYYVIDKSDSIPLVGTTINTLLNAGAKPIRFDDKTITVNFKPAVTWKALDENGTNGNFGMTRVSPWLATNDNNTSDTANWSPSSVDHHGIIYYVDGGVAGQNYRVECTATFEFKKPLQYTTVPGDKVLPVQKKVMTELTPNVLA